MNFYDSAWWLVIAAGVNTCIGNLLLKQSRRVLGDPGFLSFIFSPWFVGGLFFFGINVILFTQALEKLTVSSAYPILTGLGFTLIAIFSSVFFGERLGLNQWLGMGTIIAGMVLMSRP